MRTTATMRIQNIISEYCTDFHESGVLKNIMFDAIEAKKNVQRKQLTVNLLERLLKKNIGTNQVENMVRKFKPAGGRVLSEEMLMKERLRMVQSHMKDKVTDSKIQLTRARHRQQRIESFLHSRVVQYPGLWRFFCEIQQCEAREIWDNGVDKNNNKVKHLSDRWNPPRKQVDRIWKGVLIGDAELEELKTKLGMNENQDVPTYGGAEVSDNLKAFLRLPPGMTTFEELDDIKFNADLEAMMVKQRWEERNKEERDGDEWTEEWEVKEAEASKVKEDTNINFSKKESNGSANKSQDNSSKADS